MKTNIYLIRHAHSTYTPDELNRPLSLKGSEDAIVVTNRLAQEKINLVFASPFKRAIQTVEGIAQCNNQEVIIDEHFKERLLSNQSIPDFDAMISKSWQDFNFCFEGGECNQAAQLRGIQGIETLLATYRGKNIVIGTHGNIMVLILNHYHQQYDYSFWKSLKMPAIYKLSFEGNVLKKIDHLNLAI